MATGRFIGYIRVSTAKQGRSGLGLEAQQHAIQQFLNGGDWQLLQTFVEVESGKKNNRPQLKAALEACQRTGAKLIIAKLDRLSRNVAFIATLMEAGVKFIACDMPQATEFTVHILAAVAQHERMMISQRTKDALKAAKARGKRLGNPHGFDSDSAKVGRIEGAKARKAHSQTFASKVHPHVAGYREQGLSFREVAKRLNDEGVLTASGQVGKWTGAAVRKICIRVEGRKAA